MRNVEDHQLSVSAISFICLCVNTVEYFVKVWC